MKIDLIAFNCRYTHSCLALFYLRNELEGHLPGCAVSLRQFTINDPYFDTLLRVAESEAEVRCFSAYVWNAAYLRRLLNDLHRLRPGLLLVLGGPQAQALREGLAFWPAVVHDQIEGVEDKFYQDLAAGRLEADYQGGVNARFSYPYKQEDFVRQLKNRYLYYETSRGCPFSCAYCLSSVSRGVVYKELPKVEEELGELFRCRPTNVRFVDRTFNADPGRALAIWRFLREHAPRDCLFHFEMAPDRFSEEMFVFLAGIEAGRFQFELGLQSTDPATLKAVNRQMDVPRALANIRRLRILGNIRLHLDLILGLPGQDRQGLAQSVREALAVEPHYLQMGLLKVLPGTALARQAEAHGIMACQEPPYQVWQTGHLDHPALSGLYWLGECLEAFYNSGHFQAFFSHLIRRGTDMFAFFEGLSRRCAACDFFGRAKTQAAMHEILVAQLAAGLSECEAGLRRELLTFDWLRHGHRLPPPGLAHDLAAHREHLWHKAPEAVAGLYAAGERNHFFRRGVFVRFSPALFAAVGLGDAGGDGGYVGFLPGKRQGETRVVALVPGGSPASGG